MLFYSLTFALEEIRISVAILDFSNNTGEDSYDYLEKAIPKTMMSELSKSNRIVIVERDKIKKILREHELSMTGITDSSKLGNVGQLISADYIVHGDFTFIDKTNKKLVVNAHYVKVESGAAKSEKAKGYLRFLDGHIELLANNLTNRIAGENEFLTSIDVGSPYSTYLLIGTGISVVTTGVLHYFFLQKRDDYKNSETLSSINDNYDSSEKLFWARNSFAGATLLIGTITALAYIYNWGDTGEILAVLPTMSKTIAKDNINEGIDIFNDKIVTEYGLYLLYSARF